MKNEIANIRDHFGLSQPQLALVLSITTAQVKMAEGGRRNLPEKAMPIFRWLEAQAKTMPKNPPALDYSKDKLAFLLLKLESKKRKLTRLISDFYKKQQQQQAAIVLAQQFAFDFPDASGSSAAKVMEGIGLLAQANRHTEMPDRLMVAKNKLAGLETMIEDLENRLK